MTRNRVLAVTLSVMVAVAATGCLPIQRIPLSIPTDPRTGGHAIVLPCTIPVSGDAPIRGTGHGVRPFLDEITRLSGVRFVAAPHGVAASRGLRIVDLGPSRRHHGWGTMWIWDGSSPREFSRGLLELHDAAPPDAVRHELGHAVLGFGHARSGVMRGAMGQHSNSGWSRAEREAIVAVGRASGCRR